MYSFSECGSNQPQQPAGRSGGEGACCFSDNARSAAAAAGAGRGMVENEGAETASEWSLRSLHYDTDEGEIRVYLFQVEKDNRLLVGFRQQAYLVSVSVLISAW